MNILEELKTKGKLEVLTTQKLCIYTKDQVSESECLDTNKKTQLNVENIDDSYGLEIQENGDIVEVYIPKNARVFLRKGSPNIDCTVLYKNIECDLFFEDEPIDNYFELVER